MHLIWENTIKNLILHWTGEFKGLDHRKESYTLPNAIWEGISALTASSGSTIPSAYGCRVPNIKKDHHICTADMWSFWTLYISPHFILLVKLLTTCLKFEITSEEIIFIHSRFIDWVEKYERFHYQHDASRMSTCPVTIHVLLHIADSIKTCGPVWCYWAFPVERYCNRVKPAIRSRRFPYTTIDWYILEDAQLTQVKAIYDLSDELALQPSLPVSSRALISQDRSDFPIEDPSGMLLCPRVVIQQGSGIQGTSLLAGLSKSITAALSTDARDIIHSSGLMKQTVDHRDATFVWYVMLPQTFYGQLEHLYLVNFTCSDARVEPHKPIILAAIQNCKIKDPGPTDLEGLDVHLYNTTGSLDVVDVTSIQALVGRVEYIVDGGGWAIIDRSGSLAHAEWDPIGNDNELDT
ncbi:hypothetical protein EI94DRAFT_1773176 [Lactarius quietus]|nr:hypothetical protein EI94DRAFT_1773176 [Lactarius quietus]